jgi:hypothetical protein
MKVHFIPVSQNAKTGPIPISIIERASCWLGCALSGNGCYAETGVLARHWARVSRGLAGGSWPQFCAKVGALWPGRLWRYAPAGDLPGYGPAIDAGLLGELAAANAGERAIAFTHKPVLGDDPAAAANRRLIAAAVEAGFAVNLSADNPAHADQLAALAIAPVVTVLAHAYGRKAIRRRFKRRRDEWAETIGEWRDRTASLPRYTPAGKRIAICPATYSAATCKSCSACAHARDAVIGFPAHGAWRQVEAATAARDVAVGEPWAFRDHRIMAQVIAEKPQQPDAFTLQICGSGGARRQKPSIPRLAACPAGFLRFGRGNAGNFPDLCGSSTRGKRVRWRHEQPIAGSRANNPVRPKSSPRPPAMPRYCLKTWILRFNEGWPATS